MKRITAVIAALIIIGSGGSCAKQAVQPTKMVDGQKAEQEAFTQQQKSGDNFNCWAEINTEMPSGYEIICREYLK